MRKRDKALLFVEHIERHLKKMEDSQDLKVICKICGKTIDQIAEEESKKK
jgi:hypothetical protein